MLCLLHSHYHANLSFATVFLSQVLSIRVSVGEILPNSLLPLSPMVPIWTQIAKQSPMEATALNIQPPNY